MAKPIETQNLSIHKEASATALAAILAAEPPWLNLDTVRRQQGRAIARAYASGWQPRDFVEAYVQARAGACTAEERANAEAVYARLKLECDNGTLKASRPRSKTGEEIVQDDRGQESQGEAEGGEEAAGPPPEKPPEDTEELVDASGGEGSPGSAKTEVTGADVVQMSVTPDELSAQLAKRMGQRILEGGLVEQ